MIVFDDLPKLKRRVDKLRQRADQAKGARDQIMLRLKKEYGCSTIEEAEEKLKEMREEERKLLKVYLKKKKAFEEKWADELKDIDDGTE